MDGKSWRLGALAAVLALGLAYAARADEDKPIDGGKAEEFKGKAFDLKEKGRVKLILSFLEGKKASVTVRSDKETDVNLFVYDEDKKVVAKDDSPGPSCDLTFTPKKAGKYVLEILNKGPGANRSTIKVTFGETKTKSGASE
jgi:hypothetical protein